MSTISEALRQLNKCNVLKESNNFNSFESEEEQGDYIANALEFVDDIMDKFSEETCERIYYKDFEFDKKGPEDYAEELIYNALRSKLNLNEAVTNPEIVNDRKFKIKSFEEMQDLIKEWNANWPALKNKSMYDSFVKDNKYFLFDPFKQTLELCDADGNTIEKVDLNDKRVAEHLNEKSNRRSLQESWGWGAVIVMFDLLNDYKEATGIDYRNATREEAINDPNFMSFIDPWIAERLADNSNDKGANRYSEEYLRSFIKYGLTIDDPIIWNNKSTNESKSDCKKEKVIFNESDSESIDNAEEKLERLSINACRGNRDELKKLIKIFNNCVGQNSANRVDSKFILNPDDTVTYKIYDGEVRNYGDDWEEASSDLFSEIEYYADRDNLWDCIIRTLNTMNESLREDAEDIYEISFNTGYFDFKAYKDAMSYGDEIEKVDYKDVKYKSKPFSSFPITLKGTKRAIEEFINLYNQEMEDADLPKINVSDIRLSMTSDIKEDFNSSKAITGNPITWNKEDEERYNTEGPRSGDLKDIAANAAYVLDSVGKKLYGFKGENENSEWLIDIEGNGDYNWYQVVGGKLYKTKPEKNIKEDFNSSKPAQPLPYEEVKEFIEQVPGGEFFKVGYMRELGPEIASKFKKGVDEPIVKIIKCTEYYGSTGTDYEEKQATKDMRANTGKERSGNAYHVDVEVENKILKTAGGNELLQFYPRSTSPVRVKYFISLDNADLVETTKDDILQYLTSSAVTKLTTARDTENAGADVVRLNLNNIYMIGNLGHSVM